MSIPENPLIDRPSVNSTTSCPNIQWPTIHEPTLENMATCYLAAEYQKVEKIQTILFKNTFCRKMW